MIVKAAVPSTDDLGDFKMGQLSIGSIFPFLTSVFEGNFWGIEERKASEPLHEMDLL